MKNERADTAPTTADTRRQPTGRRFTIELRELPSDVPVEVRLRRALKLFLRAFNLRCESIVEVNRQRAVAATAEATTAKEEGGEHP